MNSPKVGFVSLGCPKALVDSERILTQLRIDGYSIVPNYDDADIVVVNTCGFIDSAKEESLQAIGEAIDENGKVIVTGCLGKQAELITKSHPKVLLHQLRIENSNHHPPQPTIGSNHSPEKQTNKCSDYRKFVCRRRIGSAPAEQTNSECAKQPNRPQKKESHPLFTICAKCREE